MSTGRSHTDVPRVPTCLSSVGFRQRTYLYVRIQSSHLHLPQFPAASLLLRAVSMPVTSTHFPSRNQLHQRERAGPATLLVPTLSSNAPKYVYDNPPSVFLEASCSCVGHAPNFEQLVQQVTQSAFYFLSLLWA